MKQCNIRTNLMANLNFFLAPLKEPWKLRWYCQTETVFFFLDYLKHAENFAELIMLL